MSSLEKIKLLILDVDGTLTDSGLFFDEEGHELKQFSTRDYVGVMAAHYIGIKVAIVTGRKSYITQKRAEEMHVDYLYQGVKNKSNAIKSLMEENECNFTNIGYIGDDLNDLASMKPVAFRACPADACIEIKEVCNYISTISGGKGVVQDVMRYVLNNIGKWDDFITDVIMKGY